MRLTSRDLRRQRVQCACSPHMSAQRSSLAVSERVGRFPSSGQPRHGASGTSPIVAQLNSRRPLHCVHACAHALARHVVGASLACPCHGGVLQSCHRPAPAGLSDRCVTIAQKCCGQQRRATVKASGTTGNVRTCALLFANRHLRRRQAQHRVNRRCRPPAAAVNAGDAAAVLPATTVLSTARPPSRLRRQWVLRSRRETLGGATGSCRRRSPPYAPGNCGRRACGDAVLACAPRNAAGG